MRGKGGKREGKINGKDWDDIIAPLLCHQPPSKDLSLWPWFSLELPALLIPELSQSCSWLKKNGNRDIPDLVTSLWPHHPLQMFPEEFGKRCCWFFPIFLFTFHPLGMNLEVFLSLTSFLQSCFHPFPSFLWRKTWKAEAKPLGTGRFRGQRPSFHHLFHLS